MSISIDLSEAATDVVAAISPTTLWVTRNIERIESIPRTKVAVSAGIPNVTTIVVRHMKAEPATPGAPTDSSSAVRRTVTIIPNVISSPDSLASSSP